MRNLILALLLLPSCITSRDGAMRRVANLNDKWRLIDTIEVVKIDTTFKEVDRVFYRDSVTSYLDLNKQTDTIIVYLQENCEKLRGKSNLLNIKNRIKSACKLESILKPITFDSAGVVVKIWPKGESLHVSLKFKEAIITRDVKRDIVKPVIEKRSFLKNLWSVKEFIAGMLIAIMFFLFAWSKK